MHKHLGIYWLIVSWRLQGQIAVKFDSKHKMIFQRNALESVISKMVVISFSNLLGL